MFENSVNYLHIHVFIYIMALIKTVVGFILQENIFNLVWIVEKAS